MAPMALTSIDDATVANVAAHITTLKESAHPRNIHDEALHAATDAPPSDRLRRARSACRERALFGPHLKKLFRLASDVLQPARTIVQRKAST